MLIRHHLRFKLTGEAERPIVEARAPSFGCQSTRSARCLAGRLRALARVELAEVERAYLTTVYHAQHLRVIVVLFLESMRDFIEPLWLAWYVSLDVTERVVILLGLIGPFERSLLQHGLG